MIMTVEGEREDGWVHLLWCFSGH